MLFSFQTQDPFDDVGQEYRMDLDASQDANLQQALRHINVEKLIAELYEYIALNLKRSNNQEQNHQATWRYAVFWQYRPDAFCLGGGHSHFTSDKGPMKQLSILFEC